MTPPKEHCGHECVCSLYGVECWYGKHKTDKSEPCDMSGVLTRPCKHDTRSRPHPAPAKCGCDGCRKETEHLDCPTPGKCDQMKCPLCCEGSDFPTLPEEIKKYEEQARREERERIMRIARSETMYDGIHEGWLMYDSFRQEVESMREGAGK